MEEEKNWKEHKNFGKCNYCDEKAEALVRGKKLCHHHWNYFKQGKLFIPLFYK